MGPLNMAIDHAERKLCPLMRPAGETEIRPKFGDRPVSRFGRRTYFAMEAKTAGEEGTKNNCCGELISEDTKAPRHHNNIKVT